MTTHANPSSVVSRRMSPVSMSGTRRIRVTVKIKRRDFETGAAQLKRQMAAAGGRLQHPALDRNRPQQRRHNPRCVESQIAVALDALKTGRRDVGVPLRGRPCSRLVGRDGRCDVHPRLLLALKRRDRPLDKIGFDQVALALNHEPRRGRRDPRRVKMRLSGSVKRHSDAEPVKLLERRCGQAPRRARKLGRRIR